MSTMLLVGSLGLVIFLLPLAARARAIYGEIGKTIEFSATLRIDTPQEILYYQHGGILQYVLRQLAAKA